MGRCNCRMFLLWLSVLILVRVGLLVGRCRTGSFLACVVRRRLGDCALSRIVPMKIMRCCVRAMLLFLRGAWKWWRSRRVVGWRCSVNSWLWPVTVWGFTDGMGGVGR